MKESFLEKTILLERPRKRAGLGFRVWEQQVFGTAVGDLEIDLYLIFLSLQSDCSGVNNLILDFVYYWHLIFKSCLERRSC